MSASLCLCFSFIFCMRVLNQLWAVSVRKKKILPNICPFISSLSPFVNVIFVYCFFFLGEKQNRFDSVIKGKLRFFLLRCATILCLFSLFSFFFLFFLFEIYSGGGIVCCLPPYFVPSNPLGEFM